MKEFLSNAVGKFKNFTKTQKTLTALALAALLTIADGTFFFVNAESPSGGGVSSGMTSALQTAFANVQTDVTSIITTALPYALAIMGLIIAIRVGVSFFKRTAK